MAGENHTMSVVNNTFQLTHTIDTAGNKDFTLYTLNQFVDKNIEIKTYTPPAVGLSYNALTNDITNVTVNTTNIINNEYELTNIISGTITANQAGWFSGPLNINHTAIVGKIAQSSFTGQTVTPTASTQTVIISPGYYHTNREIIIEPTTSGTSAVFSNQATSDVIYTDVSDTTFAPVLIADDYLYVDAGYVDNIKISLAKLVPDGSDVKGHAEYILQGHSAYDNDGVLVTGNVTTYTGDYSVL